MSWAAVRARPSPTRSSDRRWTPPRTRRGATAPPAGTSGTVHSRVLPKSTWSSPRSSSWPRWSAEPQPPPVRPPGWATVLSGCVGLCLASDPCAKHNQPHRTVPGDHGQYCKRTFDVFETRECRERSAAESVYETSGDGDTLHDRSAKKPMEAEDGKTTRNGYFDLRSSAAVTENFTRRTIESVRGLQN